jgi:hypothetical protein
MGRQEPRGNYAPKIDQQYQSGLDRPGGWGSRLFPAEICRHTGIRIDRGAAEEGFVARISRADALNPTLIRGGIAEFGG